MEKIICECCEVEIKINDIYEHTITKEHQEKLIKFLKEYHEKESKLVFNQIE